VQREAKGKVQEGQASSALPSVQALSAVIPSAVGLGRRRRDRLQDARRFRLPRPRRCDFCRCRADLPIEIGTTLVRARASAEGPWHVPR
jgi:hypothetical protein